MIVLLVHEYSQICLLVQHYCSTQFNCRIVIVLSIGEGVFYCEAFGEALHKAKAKMTVSEVLESIDKKVGLGVPIFLFGLEALGRGVSTRSSGRVATHLLVSLGPGHSLDNVIQSYGRGTGNVKSILRKNLGEDATIKILTIESDWKDSKAYVKYCQAKVEGKTLGSLEHYS